MPQSQLRPAAPSTAPVSPSMDRATALDAFRRVRGDSEALCAPLQTDDYILQSIAETSPPKWHLAHVSWFFETFLLEEFATGYRPFHPHYRRLFNSYYEQVGPFHPRPQRGMLSRPTVEEIYRYRAWVDEHMATLIDELDEAQWPAAALRIAIGLHHEQQHQELLLTDIKHNLWVNPLFPAYRSDLPTGSGTAPALTWRDYEGGLRPVGYDGPGFAYDNERPRHPAYVAPYRLANRLVTNGEYAAFMEDGGYERPELWLSDGWATVKSQSWRAPLYWLKQDNQWFQFTLAGLRPQDEHEPVCHLSYYEADAFARWAGKRLPTEQEWELAATGQPIRGNFRDSARLHPQPAQGTGLEQLYGDLWEWTASPYSPYPGYRTPAGALGEYNAKFMCNQLVLRGGSCATPLDHIRASYRNFFYPHDRWQFKGLRLAEDAS